VNTYQDELPRTSSPARTFPAGFLWGAATAAFQVEGATAVDGRTDSIWDVHCRRPGAIVGGDTGEPAADHYRRMREDVALMAELGLTSYRFSVAWSRIRPDGGPVNPVGLDFYRRLVDELLAHDIAPWVTLYHWDLPQVLEDAGGWPARDTAYRFAEYADTVYGALGDRVGYWTTMNEPFCAALLGYASGEHAPGRAEPAAAVAAVHHLLLGHGLAVQAIRARNPHETPGITLNFAPTEPLDPADPADVDTARRVDGLQNRLFLEPVLRGHYPADVLADLAPYGLPEHIRDGDLDVISTPVALLGVNYYLTNVVSAHPAPAPPASDVVTPSPPGSIWVGAEHASFRRSGHPLTGQDWEIDPDGLTGLLIGLNRDYPDVPLYVTENGAAFPDEVVDGAVHDPDRTAFLAGHLRAIHAAIEAGADIRGYFYWSLLDNFEWAWGYGQRFGLVHVDYETQRRTVKSSGRWYAAAIANNAVG
jgi:beta-glucosidase